MRCNPLARGIVRFSERETFRLILLACLVRHGRVTEWPRVEVDA